MKTEIGLVCMLAITTFAQSTVYWNATDDDLSAASNWQGGVLPTDADTIIFGQQGAVTLTTSTWMTNASAPSKTPTPSPSQPSQAVLY